MTTTYLILGGARSGKSRRALALAEQMAGRRVFIATAEAWDAEMGTRIERHKRERGAGWTTNESPLDIVKAIQNASEMGDVCLVDCLTLWLSNLMHHDRNLEQEYLDLQAAIKHSTIPVILVSNEVGMGLVPETALGRNFRDAQGRLNQAIAKTCDRVEFVAAGLPITLKG